MAVAAPAADVVVVWAPNADVAPVLAAARAHGAAAIDRSPPAVAPPQTAQLLQKGIDAVDQLRYGDAGEPLEQALELVDRTGAAGLSNTQLADLFFYRSQLHRAQGNATLAWDVLAESIKIAPTRVFDPARFSPRDLADIQRAEQAVQQAAQSLLAVEAPFGCAIAIDAKTIQGSSQQLYVGSHWVRVTCADREPWSARVELIAKGAQVVAQPKPLEPPSDAELLVQASAASARALVAVEVRGKVATARLIGLDGRERDRRTISVGRDLAPVAAVVGELLVPVKVVRPRWYQSKWAWAAGAAVIAAGVLVPLTYAIAGGNNSATFTLRPKGLSF